MKLVDFIDIVDLEKLNEIEKVTMLLFYIYKKENINTFTMKQICQNLRDSGFSSPNTSRLKSKMLLSKIFKYDKQNNSFHFLPVPLQRIEKEHSKYFENFEKIISESEIIDESKFCGYRGYIDKLIKQINSSYSNNCYDACAVLMRRLFEICLILAYQELGIDVEIKNPDMTYFMLEKIVKNAKNNKTLNFSRIKNDFDKIRDIGNFAAHRIEYNTSKMDVDDIKIIYRTALEELYYKMGIMK